MLKTIVLAAILALGLLGVDSACANINRQAVAYEHEGALARTPHAIRFLRHHRHGFRVGLRVHSHFAIHYGRDRHAGYAAYAGAQSASLAIAGAAAEPSQRFDAGGNVVARGRHPLLAVASHYLGRGNFTRRGGPWCRDFINVVARQAGYQLSNTSRRAIDALRLGHRVSSPQPGDLVVMRHHVTIFAGWGGGRLIGLGGNQHRSVRYSHFSRRSVVAFVRL